MKKTKKLVFTLCAVLLSVSQKSYPLSTGTYGNVSGGSISWEGDIIGSSDSTHVPFLSIGAGVVLDTDLGNDSILNHRICFTYNREHITGNRHANWIVEPFLLQSFRYNQQEIWYNRFSFDYIACFSIINTDRFRFWIGPGAGISYYSLSRKSYESPLGPIPPFPTAWAPITHDYHIIQLNTGLFLGVNIAIGNSVSLFAQAGINVLLSINGHSSSYDDSFENPGLGYEWHTRLGALYHIDGLN